MRIPTEPIGSIPRPQKLITAFAQYDQGSLSQKEFESICGEAVRETIEKFEATGSPVITDGEQTKPRFATYPQAVISPSALSLLYPPEGIADYPQEKLLEDLVNEAATDIRGCLEHGAHCVQIDFTEGRLAV